MEKIWFAMTPWPFHYVTQFPYIIHVTDDSCSLNIDPSVDIRLRNHMDNYFVFLKYYYKIIVSPQSIKTTNK